ncbi:MAG: glutamine-hydrolyzing GMP synthase [Candidatus Omnitrophica bacterium]|nr:glutamine-hydrolyzing GMP synthase [Candidatus Omnitrophota bacterium]
MKEVVVVLDFGSQYNQLIARRIREKKVYSRILPFNVDFKTLRQLAPKGIILSGGPASVYQKGAPRIDKRIFKLGIPILGICYGMQAMVYALGGRVSPTQKREYGSATLFIDDAKDLFLGIPQKITCWMSHQDIVERLPEGFERLAHTDDTLFASIVDRKKKLFGVQFHPEVAHTQYGSDIIENFLYKVCECIGLWTMESFIEDATKKIRQTVRKGKVLCALSGGVDSSVTAALFNKAIGRKLFCIFVDNGLLRKNETNILRYIFVKKQGINLKIVNASKRFLSHLKGVTDPEEKRKIIGNEFIKVFEEESKNLGKIKFLAQGTLYPDIIESTSSFGGPSSTIKTHHNVGGLPKRMKLRLIEPLRDLFKDEVRVLGKKLGLPDSIVLRHPFPGPGLGVRIIGEITTENIRILREADEIVIEEIKKAGLYKSIWQSFAVLLPIKSVGVMGDERTYEKVIAIRAVESVDGMTADWVKMPYEVLNRLSNRIINEVKGVNRVVYDICSKPPSTIEWE